MNSLLFQTQNHLISCYVFSYQSFTGTIGYSELLLLHIVFSFAMRVWNSGVQLNNSKYSILGKISDNIYLLWTIILQQGFKVTLCYVSCTKRSRTHQIPCWQWKQDELLPHPTILQTWDNQYNPLCFQAATGRKSKVFEKYILNYLQPSNYWQFYWKPHLRKKFKGRILYTNNIKYLHQPSNIFCRLWQQSQEYGIYEQTWDI